MIHSEAEFELAVIAQDNQCLTAVRHLVSVTVVKKQVSYSGLITTGLKRKKKSTFTIFKRHKKIWLCENGLFSRNTSFVTMRTRQRGNDAIYRAVSVETKNQNFPCFISYSNELHLQYRCTD